MFQKLSKNIICVLYIATVSTEASPWAAPAGGLGVRGGKWEGTLEQSLPNSIEQLSNQSELRPNPTFLVS